MSVNSLLLKHEYNILIMQEYEIYLKSKLSVIVIELIEIKYWSIHEKEIVIFEQLCNVFKSMKVGYEQNLYLFWIHVDI